MARGSDYPLGAAMSTVKSGLSARAGLRAFRQGGGRTTDATWFRMVSQVRAELADQLAEATRPLSRRPLTGEISVIDSITKSGYWQQMTVFARDRQTGEVYTSDFVVRGAGLLTRQAAIDFATAEWEAGSAGSPNPHDDVLLGVAYVSTLELRPARSPGVPTVAQAAMTPPPTPSAPLDARVLDTIRGLRGRMDLPESDVPVGQGDAPSQRLMRQGGWVSLMDLRAALSDVPRGQVDAAIVRLAGARQVKGTPDVTQYSMLEAERRAALTIGNQSVHWVWIEP